MGRDGTSVQAEGVKSLAAFMNIGVRRIWSLSVHTSCGELGQLVDVSRQDAALVLLLSHCSTAFYPLLAI